MLKYESSQLPTTLSGWIEKAVQDVEEVRKDHRYRLDSGNWYYKPEDENVCYVCLAGSVLAKSFNEDWDQAYRDPDNYEDEVRDIMLALDAVRQGDWEEAIWCCTRDARCVAKAQDVIQGLYLADPPHLENWEAAKAYYLKGAERLKEVGL